MKGILLHILFLIIPLTVINGQDHEDMEDRRLDSLIRVANEARLDTNKLRILYEICIEHYNVDTVNKYANIELELSRKLKEPLYEARAFSLLYWCNYHYNDFVKANTYAYKAIVIADSIGESKLVAKNYSNLGISFAAMQDANKSDEYFHKALDIYTQRHDSSYMAETLRDIGYNNSVHRMFKEAEECYNKALEIDIARRDSDLISEDRLGLASALLSKYEFHSMTNDDTTPLRQSKHEYNTAFKIADKTGNDYAKFIYYVEMPRVLMYEIDNEERGSRRYKELTDSCKLFIDQAYHIADRDGYETDKLLIDFEYTSYLTIAKQYKKAENLLDSLNKAFQEDEELHRGHFHKLYNAYSVLYKSKGDLKKSLEYFQKYHYHYLNSHNQDYAIAATQNMVKAQFDEEIRAQKERELLLKTQAKQQTIITTAVVIVLLLLTILTIFIVHSYIRSRKVNMMLDQKNREITDSINYASLIQRAAMPSKVSMSETFGDYMVIFRPLNIISGDFFWASNKGDLKALAVADCTGHGVPGAFLSMLGMAILEYISQRHNEGEVSAGKMLDDMKKVFKQSLHQNGNEADNHDGIDIAIVIIDTKKKQIHYAGAFRPLIIASEGRLTKYDADRMPIGAYYNESEHFTDHVIDVKTGDTLYLFSDGITDQFGYDEKHEVHKFTAKRFKSLLSSIAHLPLSEQKTLISNAIDEWRTDSRSAELEQYEQTDDTTIVGVRVG
ncbi:MAG: SpoIIE family protein phosphatase [Bacteroidales bacterium]|nr:SpoIIE family protein phosphatase [Bacteroidales bacterium]